MTVEQGVMQVGALVAMLSLLLTEVEAEVVEAPMMEQEALTTNPASLLQVLAMAVETVARTIMPISSLLLPDQELLVVGRMMETVAGDPVKNN